MKEIKSEITFAYIKATYPKVEELARENRNLKNGIKISVDVHDREMCVGVANFGDDAIAWSFDDGRFIVNLLAPKHKGSGALLLLGTLKWLERKKLLIEKIKFTMVFEKDFNWIAKFLDYENRETLNRVLSENNIKFEKGKDLEIPFNVFNELVKKEWCKKV